MKLARTLVYGLLASAPLSAAATLPLDRPTPPPCCVDGVCHAHAARFGYFPTRWRTWPGLGVAPMPTLQPPDIRTIPGLPTIEPPTPEDEDRQAPEPTKPAAPAPLNFAPPAAGVPRTTPLDSQENRGPDGSTPGPNTTPGPGGPTTQPLGPFPFGPQPTTTPAPTGTSTGPAGGTRSPLDFDQPPAPPSANWRTPTTPGPPTAALPAATPAVQQATAWQAVTPNAATTKARNAVEPASATVAPPPARRPASNSNDPPPPPPLAFRGAMR